MSATLPNVTSIVIPPAHRATIVEHARRKLAQRYREDETPERQAFGLLAGKLVGELLLTTAVFPLRRNLRGDPLHGAAVDAVVRELAIPSRTPLHQRGWLAAPHEVMAAQARCDAEDMLLFGSYHMHKTAWEHDPDRDTPTALDTALAHGLGQWMAILSMVDPGRPLLRAFWEGRPEREARISAEPPRDAAAHARRPRASSA